jgi:hypothetical protein
MLFTRATGFAFPTFLLLTSAASALTADELWAEAQRLAKEAGAPVTATTRREGDRLVLTDIAIPIGPTDDAADLRLKRIDLQDRPDGTVAVLLPPSFPVTFDLRVNEPDFDLMTLTASAPDFSLVVSGIGDQAAFDLKVPSLTMSLEKIMPALGPTEEFDFNIALADLGVQHKMDLTTSAISIASSARLGTLHWDILADTDRQEEKFTASFDLSGVEGKLDAVVPPSVSRQRMREIDKSENPLPEILKAFNDGLTMQSGVSFEGFGLRVDVDSPAEKGTVEFTSASGHVKGRFDPEAAGYDISLGKTSMLARGLPELEVPEVAMSVAEFGYGISFGIGDLVSPQEARVHARLVDLTLPPEIWAKSDPTGILGSEPMSYAIDILAHYALSPEMLQPGWKPDPNVFPPVDLVDVVLKELKFRGVGIVLDGGGSLTFDESDLVTYPDFPAPEGKVTITATGVNTLIDRLVAAGLVPDEELAGLRMGLMFIAKAGATPDSLKSEVEFNDKSFYLNGLKIR